MTYQLLKARMQWTRLSTTDLYVLKIHKDKISELIFGFYIQIFTLIPQIRTYLTSVVRMAYVRLSSFSSVTVQGPEGREVWTNSCNAVKSFPSCIVTAFSMGSCWPAVCVASSLHQEQRNKNCFVNIYWQAHHFIPLNNNPSGVWQDSYRSQIWQMLSDFSLWKWATPLHQVLFQPGTGPAAEEKQTEMTTKLWRRQSNMFLQYIMLLFI